MTPTEFKARASTALGGYGWATKMARGCGVTTSTVHRWINGTVPIPGYAVTIVEMIEWMRASGVRTLPARFDR